MIFTRLGYLLIVAIIAAAAGAIYWVVRPDDGESLPELDVQQVVNYARFGQVERIEVDGRDLTVTFIDDLDTQSAFGEDARTFRATLPEDTSIFTILEANGVQVGGGSGLTVTQR